MHTRRHVRRLVAGILSIVAVMALGVASVAAHTMTLDPPAGTGGFTNEPISKPWAQAHCNAQSPAIVSDASGGVVAFNPPTALPCPHTVTNPGGQVTGP